MNSFDAVVLAGLIIAMVTGFNAGLLRSTATIIGYLVAMPVAAWITTLVSPQINRGADPSPLQSPLLLFAVFLITGVGFGKLLRTLIDDVTGTRIGLLDRLAGAGLGAVRLGLVAITMVLIFDQLVPANRQPAFLSESLLRPTLSLAGRQGFKSLPPDITAYIDRIKHERGI